MALALLAKCYHVLSREVSILVATKSAKRVTHFQEMLAESVIELYPLHFTTSISHGTPLGHDSVLSLLSKYKVCIVHSGAELLEFLLFDRCYLLKSAQFT